MLGIAGTASVWLLSAVFASGQAAGQAGQGPRPQMSEEVFKNVQILKGIPVDEFMDTMGMFAASLSLNCIDCHVAESVGTWDKFADETPLKRTARKMVLMVNAINKDNFSGVRSVTCYTCHRGDLRPRILPNLAAQSLYTRFGFRRIAVRRGYYPAHSGREDALVYTLALS